MSFRKGALSYRAIGTLIIALAIIAVGTLLIIEFSTPINTLDERTHSTIADALSRLFGGDERELRQITGEFKTDKIAKMIRKCWQGDQERSRICYVLRGKFSAEKEEVRGRLSRYLTNHLKINANLSKGPLTIKYNKPQNLVVVD